MNLLELYNRVIETTGQETITVESISVAVANCYADLTSRGYRLFEEKVYKPSEITQSGGLAFIKKPKNLRKTLYFRILFDGGVAVAHRIEIGNPRIQSSVSSNGFRTPLSPNEVIYYVKGDEITIEWNLGTYGNIVNIMYGYYARLVPPRIAANADELEQIVLNIRKEFEDAVVLYAVYFYTQRFLSEDNKIQLALNNYKYFIEDLLHELAFEDTYNEGDYIIVEE